MKTLSTTPVRDIMIKEVVTIPQGTSLSEAAEKMLNHGVGSLIVVNKDKAVGIVTERDFVNLIKDGEANSKWLIVDDMMPEKLITVTPSTSSSKAFALLNTYNIKRLPVLQNGKLKGLLTIRQIMVYSRNTLIAAQDKNRSLRREANTDELTGAYNKRYLLRRIKDEYTRVLHYGIHSSLIFLDLDHFKKINDTYTHVVGDDVLKTLGKIIRKYLREPDVFARGPIPGHWRKSLP